MGIEALTRRDDGSALQPTAQAEWDDWVSATRTRNYVLGDPVLDWLELCGEAHGFQRDTELPQYDERTDFTRFVFAQARRFEDAVVGLLRQRYEIVTIASGPQDARSLEAAESTFQAMIEGAPIVYQGVLLDPQHRTYGMPDLLVRSDVLAELYPDALAQDEAHHAAPDLGGRGYHYRVVDIKFGTLGLLAGGDLNNAGSAPAYKVQIFNYNQALGRLQGFEPPTSFLLGRGWTQGKDRGSNCLDRLVPVQQAGAPPGKRLISGVAAEAIAWVRKTRTEGVKWRVLPEPSTPELYPNASNNEDGPWHHAKRGNSTGNRHRPLKQWRQSSSSMKKPPSRASSWPPANSARPPLGSARKGARYRSPTGPSSRGRN